MFAMNKITVSRLFALVSFLILAACVNNVNHGHLKEDVEVSQIHVGTTTRSEVLKMLGSPSSEASFGNKTWYYVSTIKQTRSILPSKIVDQHTTEISFYDNDTVSDIKQYSLDDSKNIEMVKRTTPTEGETLGFFEQIFANLGRFNKNDTGTSNRHGGGGSGAPTGYPGR